MPNYGQSSAHFTPDMLQAESKLNTTCRKVKVLTMEKNVLRVVM